ncbi:MAG: hypothetical protein ABR953_11345 [Candidatus Acidiferrales bacterium]|jgi:hypothetical protein
MKEISSDEAFLLFKGWCEEAATLSVNTLNKDGGQQTFTAQIFEVLVHSQTLMALSGIVEIALPFEGAKFFLMDERDTDKRVPDGLLLSGWTSLDYRAEAGGTPAVDVGPQRRCRDPRKLCSDHNLDGNQHRYLRADRRGLLPSSCDLSTGCPFDQNRGC